MARGRRGEHLLPGNREKNRTGIFEPAAAFNHRQDGCHSRPASWLPMCIPFLRPSATGRIEFSARLWLRSSQVFKEARRLKIFLSPSNKCAHKVSRHV